jgi:membrane-bound lytic murein transglycosylase A
MRPTHTHVQLSDSLSPESFFATLKKHIAVMKISDQVKDPMIFGERKILKAKYINSLEKILDHQSDWLDWISKNYEFYEVFGREEWGSVMSTGYYGPIIYGSLIATSHFTQPLYKTPTDLITIKLKNFSDQLMIVNQSSSLVGRITDQVFSPYFDRKQIDSDHMLKNKNLELVWVTPIDSFFIQIQGSGIIEIETGERIHIGYDSQNGHPYEAIGKHLTNIIPLEKMTLQKIKSHLESLPQAEQQKIFNINPSYVFFKKIKNEALTYAGMEVSEGRSIATDLKYFPKGALAFLDIKEPLFDPAHGEDPQSWIDKPRLVFDQDTGGAIKGTGRVDLYFGQGDQAAQKAGVMKQNGRLYYLLPK